MKYIILYIALFALFLLSCVNQNNNVVLENCQNCSEILLSENFEGSLDNRISVIYTNDLSINPGVANSTRFSGVKAFRFGISNCTVNCYNRDSTFYHQPNFRSILRINFSKPTFIDSVLFNSAELSTNWGSTGTIYIDSVELYTPYKDFGKEPNSSGEVDETVKGLIYVVKKHVSILDFGVFDIANSSEIWIDDIVIKGCNNK
jgi:hypothetical protein